MAGDLVRKGRDDIPCAGVIDETDRLQRRIASLPPHLTAKVADAASHGHGAGAARTFISRTHPLLTWLTVTAAYQPAFGNSLKIQSVGLAPETSEDALMSDSQSIKKGGFTAIFLHELRMLFFAPLTYLFQGAFLLALGACIFLISSFYTTDEATVRLLLVFIPWVSLVLVPALAMSAWSDGHSNRELELVFALPVRPIHVVLGKFAAGYFLLLLTLAMTFPFCLTVAYLGEPDLGLVFSSYLVKLKQLIQKTVDYSILNVQT